MTRASWTFFTVIFLLAISLIDFVNAQDPTTNTTDSLENYKTTIDEIDNLLNILIPIGLIGVSLTGAAFLLAMLNTTEKNERSTHILLAKKDLIKGFIAFLICVIVIFIFDFVEIIIERISIQILILDIVLAYGLFGFGLTFLVKAARQIYNTI